MAKSQIERFKKPKILNIKNIKRGVFLFIGISILAYAGLFLYTNTGQTLEVWSNVGWEYFLLGLVFIVNDLYLGGLRNHVFIRQFVPGISQIVSIKANLANIFMGAVTPSQSGGGPAQWFVFYRNGVPLADALGTSFYNWISTIIFLPLSGAFALYILKNRIPDGFIMYLTQFGLSVFTSLLIVIFLGLFASKVFAFIIMGLARFVGLLNRSWEDKAVSYGEIGINKLDEYRTKYFGLIKRKPQLMLFSFLLTIVLYMNKYVLAYVLVLGFGLEADFWTIVAIQAVVYLLLYFAPSPGGSGIAELSISVLMATAISSDYLTSFTLLYRSFLIFIPALLGSFVLLRHISKE